MDRRLFISAGLASAVIGGVAILTSGVLTPGVQDTTSLASSEGADTAGSNFNNSVGFASDPTATPAPEIPQDGSPIYVYPDGSIAPAPGSQSVSPGFWGDDDRYERDRGGEREWHGQSTTFFDLFGRGDD